MNKPVLLRQLFTACQQVFHFFTSPKSLTVNQHRSFSIYQADIPICFDDEEIYYQSNSEFRNFEAVRNLLQGYARGEHNFSGINLIRAPMSGVNLPYIDLSQSILAARKQFARYRFSVCQSSRSKPAWCKSKLR